MEFLPPSIKDYNDSSDGEPHRPACGILPGLHLNGQQVVACSI
jgi:hypothetical protein